MGFSFFGADSETDKSSLLLNTPNKSFKERNNHSERVAAVQGIRDKFPNKIPVIVERFKKVSKSQTSEIIPIPIHCQEKSLPCIDKVKYLVPRELTVAQLSTIVRNRLSLCQTDSFFLFTSSGTMLSMSRTVAELYEVSQDQDGFLYVEYASQETFGGSGKMPEPDEKYQCISISLLSKYGIHTNQ